MTIESDTNERLSSQILAGLIVDALLRSGIVREADIRTALEITIEELHIRNLAGELVYPD